MRYGEQAEERHAGTHAFLKCEHVHRSFATLLASR
jgi:hypothetical protein